MQDTMRSPFVRAILTLVFEISLVVLMMPVISLLTWKNSDITGAFSLTFYLTAIPINYIYNYVFDLVLLKRGKPLYERSVSLRIFHALLFEAILLPIQIPLAMNMLDLSFGKALTLGLSLAAVVSVYNFLSNKAFDTHL
ncbi:Uncharacterized membrane protein [Maridesulfovibrio ferrireducens]|uniref:Uncharacterized membrane protein n=1 Tax=Maridesulfovibrio ferrireducens TaxID=246191 RepID=A0A1G9IZH2_9BACT|nr:chlorhexidine efflux transporter [Maridesulfovibrio ferrireducens]SDL30264.1 Uncharacterized membrane protein [Maridesulfovibrio ferrireducens]